MSRVGFFIRAEKKFKGKIINKNLTWYFIPIRGLEILDTKMNLENPTWKSVTILSKKQVLELFKSSLKNNIKTGYYNTIKQTLKNEFINSFLG